MEGLKEILMHTKDRYKKYLWFGEIDEKEFYIRCSVLDEIDNEINYLVGNNYDGQNE